MSYLEPPKHGGGGEPDKKRLHRVFLYIKFTRWFIAIVAMYAFSDTIVSSIALSMITEPIDVKIWDTIPITNDTMFYGNIVVAMIMVIIFVYVAKRFSIIYKRVKHAHLAYCDCNRKRWYNRE